MNQRVHFLGHVEARPYEFKVCGTTGAAYIVDLNPRNPHFTCTCEDHEMEKRRCKHITFVLEKCLGFGALIATKPTAKIADKLITDAVSKRLTYFEVIAAHARKTNKVPRRPWVGNKCLMCFSIMKKDQTTTWCENCGRSVHNDCFLVWVKHRDSTCVDCGRHNIALPTT